MSCLCFLRIARERSHAMANALQLFCRWSELCSHSLQLTIESRRDATIMTCALLNLLERT